MNLEEINGEINDLESMEISLRELLDSYAAARRKLVAKARALQRRETLAQDLSNEEIEFLKRALNVNADIEPFSKVHDDLVRKFGRLLHKAYVDWGYRPTVWKYYLTPTGKKKLKECQGKKLNKLAPCRSTSL